MPSCRGLFSLLLSLHAVSHSTACEYEATLRAEPDDLEHSLSKLAREAAADEPREREKALLALAVRALGERRPAALKAAGYVHKEELADAFTARPGDAAAPLPRGGWHACVDAAASGSGSILRLHVHHGHLIPRTSPQFGVTLASASIPDASLSFHVDPAEFSGEGWAPDQALHPLLPLGGLFVSVNLQSASGRSLELSGLLTPAAGRGQPGAAPFRRQAAAQHPGSAAGARAASKADAAEAKHGGGPATATPVEADKKRKPVQSTLYVVAFQALATICAVVAANGTMVEKVISTEMRLPLIVLLPAVTFAMCVDVLLMFFFFTFGLRYPPFAGLLRALAAFLLVYIGWKANKAKMFTPSYLCILAAFIMWQSNPRY
ncbi:hypothetical protein DIPPA_33048 [Diplonema papillatum]|nr:hypothetical protein DIPPA_33048 [Diplonema papillatum]